MMNDEWWMMNNEWKMMSDESMNIPDAKPLDHEPGMNGKDEDENEDEDEDEEEDHSNYTADCIHCISYTDNIFWYVQNHSNKNLLFSIYTGWDFIHD